MEPEKIVVHPGPQRQEDWPGLEKPTVPGSHWYIVGYYSMVYFI